MDRRLLPYGEQAVLVECADLDDALGLRRRLDDERFPQVVEIIPGARTLLLRLGSPLTKAQRDQLLSWTPTRAPTTRQSRTEIVLDYDGEDLAEVAELTGLSSDEVVQTHTGQLWTVGFCGFAPGFGYLHGENDRLRVRRRPSPRKRVPAGAVGLADQWSGIYPRVGPGGWQLIGRTDSILWDLEKSPPALLQPGMQVQFVARGTR